ncbi:hypothetical protein R0J89_17480, partial [Psychrobacter sp. SIMBA_152]
RDLKVSGQTALADNFFIGGAFATLNRDGFGEFVNTGAENTPRTRNRLVTRWLKVHVLRGRQFYPSAPGRFPQWRLLNRWM